jgi:histidine triad (HIT) family protein
MSTIFDSIVSGEMKSWTVWEDDNYLAFLTPFPGTPGMTVVIPKVNQSDYVFDLSEEQLTGLMVACQKAAKLLEKSLAVERVAMVFEGTGVAHVHAKLYPLHGDLGGQTDVWTKHQEFYPEYPGYISTVEGPKVSDQDLDAMQQKIRGDS